MISLVLSFISINLAPPVTLAVIVPPRVSISISSVNCVDNTLALATAWWSNVAFNVGSSMSSKPEAFKKSRRFAKASLVGAKTVNGSELALDKAPT